MDIFETKSSKNEDASNQLLIKSKKQKQEKEENSIFPKEFMTLNRLYTLTQTTYTNLSKDIKNLIKKGHFSMPFVFYLYNSFSAFSRISLLFPWSVI